MKNFILCQKTLDLAVSLENKALRAVLGEDTNALRAIAFQTGMITWSLLI
jgi:hypothetical protein